MSGRGRLPERDPLLLLIRAAKRKIRMRATMAWATHRSRNRVAPTLLCERTGTAPPDGRWPTPLHAHHDDYSKPLEIQWLCTGCHGAVHSGWRAPKCDPYRNCWDEIARLCAELADEQARKGAE